MKVSAILSTFIAAGLVAGAPTAPLPKDVTDLPPPPTGTDGLPLLPPTGLNDNEKRGDQSPPPKPTDTELPPPKDGNEKRGDEPRPPKPTAGQLPPPPKDSENEKRGDQPRPPKPTDGEVPPPAKPVA